MLEVRLPCPRRMGIIAGNTFFTWGGEMRIDGAAPGGAVGFDAFETVGKGLETSGDAFVRAVPTKGRVPAENPTFRPDRRFGEVHSPFLELGGTPEGPVSDETTEAPPPAPLPGEETAEPDPLDGLVDVEPGIKAKKEVNIVSLVSELRSKFNVVFAAYEKFGYADLEANPMVLTSGNDSLGEHARNSYHKYDRAIDVRGKHVPDSILRKIAAEIQKKLGSDFLVIAEITRYSKYWYKDHIHIEYHGEASGTPMQ